MVDWEEFTWRTVTEFIRHIVIVFAISFAVSCVGMHRSLSYFIGKITNIKGIGDVFCVILVCSVPVYFICVIIDSLDTLHLGFRKGKRFAFIIELLSRVFYDLTYIFRNFKGYFPTLIILIIISAYGLWVYV